MGRFLGTPDLTQLEAGEMLVGAVNGYEAVPSGAGSSTEAAFSTYKPIGVERGGQMSAAASGIYIALMDSIVLSSAAGAGRGVFALDPADYLAGSRTTKLRISTSLLTNSTAPGITIQVQMFAVTSATGAAGSVTPIYGSGIAASLVTYTSPIAGQAMRQNSADFTCPSAGEYALIVLTSGAMPAACDIAIRARLQMRQV